ncbi:hypothetical protein BDV11DRAFT_186156 [Aspergillus similis]
MPAMLWQYLLLTTLFWTSVRAGWEDFADNFATDLVSALLNPDLSLLASRSIANLIALQAPLVALFGERLTKQFLAESTSRLDNLIFALCPLGILTAVVSVIRICGNSSLRAFVGRANEAPGEAENELLSCVSEGTAELFNDGGISRVSGRPRILEVVLWEEQGSYELGTLREALEAKAWYAHDEGVYAEKGLLHLPELDIPNLSLNKGIDRRGPLWFYAAALLGIILQGGTLAYAALTVFWSSGIFGNDINSAANYALPFYIYGSVSLSLGMFLCAFLIERSSSESYLYPNKPSKLYWLQPGRQSIGDQDFGAFLAVEEGPNSSTSQDLKYIKSVRGPPPKGKRPLLVFTILVTMVGFVLQFVGLRGLHPSVIIADVGSTLLMAVVRTCLRTKRLGSDGNQFRKDDRELFSLNEQELDCFAYHLEKVKSFQLMSSPVHQSVRSRSGSCATSSSSQMLNQSSGLGAKLIRTRAKLAELTSCGRHPSMDWDDLPIRKVARNLARTIEMTMKVVSGWQKSPLSSCSFELAFACHPDDDKSHGSLETYTIKLERSNDTFQWKVDANELEAILGLWTFWLLKSDSNWSQNGLGRAVGLTKNEAKAEATDLYFHKWIFRQREAMMVSSKMISFPEQTFGYFSDDYPDSKEILVVRTENSLGAMAAQDLYMQFLLSILAGSKSLGGGVDILQTSQKSFLAQSTCLDELVACFETGSLGSREDALLCIVPLLKHQDILPELAGDTSSIRERIQKLTSDGNWDDAFSILQWLCQRSGGDEFECSVYEMGLLCQRAMLHGDIKIREKGFELTRLLLQLDIRATYFGYIRGSRPSHWMNSIHQQQWWAEFSRQLGWVTWGIVNAKGDRHGMKAFLETSGVSRELTHQTDDIANNAQLIFLEWVIPELEFGPRPESFNFGDDSCMESCLDWLSRNGQDALCYWLLACWAKLGQQYSQATAKAFKYAATSGSDVAIQTLRRQGANINAFGPGGCTALIELIEAQNVEAARKLLANGADANICAENSMVPPLSFAVEQGIEEISSLLLDYGAELEIRDLGGFTPLHIACQWNRLGTCTLLLDRGANIEAMASDGHTPLNYAIANCCSRMVKLLLERGADVEATDLDGDTILMLAVRRCPEDILHLLIQHKADLKKQNKSGKTALDIAKELGRTAGIAILEAALERLSIETAKSG